MHLHDLLVNGQGLKARDRICDVLNHRVGRVLEYLVVLHGESTHGGNLGWNVGRRIVGLSNCRVWLHVV